MFCNLSSSCPGRIRSRQVVDIRCWLCGTVLAVLSSTHICRISRGNGLRNCPIKNGSDVLHGRIVFRDAAGLDDLVGNGERLKRGRNTNGSRKDASTKNGNRLGSCMRWRIEKELGSVFKWRCQDWLESRKRIWRRVLDQWDIECRFLCNKITTQEVLCVEHFFIDKVGKQKLISVLVYSSRPKWIYTPSVPYTTNALHRRYSMHTSISGGVLEIIR